MPTPPINMPGPMMTPKNVASSSSAVPQAPRKRIF